MNLLYNQYIKNEIILCKTKKVTECTQPSGYKTAKNGRTMFWCTSAECVIKKQDLFQKVERANTRKRQSF